MANARQIRFGLAVPGTGINKWAWRHNGAPPDASVNFAFYRDLTLQAEAAKVDFVFMADGVIVDRTSPPHFLNRLEPVTTLSALAGATSRIGLVATVNCSFADPYTVARQFASLDKLSGGRAGWNLVTGDVAQAAENFTGLPYLAHDERYRMAGEHLGVVQGLWDSWEDDAFVYDKVGGVFADTSKLHALDHQGEFFRVKGPLALQRSPQGQPVIFQAGQSDAGRDFAAHHAGAIFTVSQTVTDAQAFYADIARRARAFGRRAPLILPGLEVTLGGTLEEARRNHQAILEEPTLDEAIDFLSPVFSYHDFRQYDPDAAFPDLGGIGHEASRGHSDMIKRVAREEGLTLRQTAQRFSDPQTRFVGTPETIADDLQRWFEDGAADGFILMSREFKAVADEVLPILRRRGLFREDYEHETLRGHMGLDGPIHRRAATRQAA
jgi:FMN-dependent oxidoreductase (nitrilotriacetate monooxygenase family)